MGTCRYCNFGLSPNEMEKGVCISCQPDTMTTEKYHLNHIQQVLKCIERNNLESTQGKKDTKNKAPMDLISPVALRELASVLGFGATKYGKHNWRAGISWSDVYAAVLRHLIQWNSGQDTDLESGLPHLAHAMCGIMFLLEYSNTHKEKDDRYASQVSRS